MSQILSPNKHTGRLKPIRLIVEHTMEVDETGSAAEAVGNAFANPARQASAHVGVDTDSECRYVADVDTAWAAPGANADGLHLEMAGRAGQTTGDWADAPSRAILERAAQRTATWCRLYAIPARRLTDAQLADGTTKGIVGHDQVSRVFKLSTHWDPGPAFPWTPFLARVNAILGLLTGSTTHQPTQATPKAPTPPGGLTVNTIDLFHASSTNPIRGAGVKPMQRLLAVTPDGAAGAITRLALGSAQVRIFGKADWQFGPATAGALLAGK